MRFNVTTVAEGEYANVYCEMIAEVGGTGELDIFSVSFNSTEDNGFIKLAPMTGWVTAGGDFDIRIDCEVFQSPVRLASGWRKAVWSL